MLQVLVACAILFWALPPLAAQAQRVSVLVHLAEGTDRGPVRAFAAIQSGFVRYEYQVLPNVMNLRGIPSPAVAALRNIPGVLRVEEDIAVQAHLDESTGIIKALDSDLGVGGPNGAGVRVCIVDTGINKNHTAFTGRVDESAGKDFVNDDNDPNDDNGHGTHVAAIALGALANHPGVARGATLIGVKALNSAGSGSGSDIIAAIDHCAGSANADVINLSLGGGSYSGTCDSATIAVAANNAVDNGVVVVASSGNSGSSNAMGSPACGSKVIAVGATYDEARGSASWCLASNFIRCTQSCTDNTAVDLVTCFSNKSSELDVTAPGCYTTSANSSNLNNGVLDYCGTSQASPHVAGLAALLLDQDGSLTPAQVRQFIRDGAEDKGPSGFDPAYGYGRINAVNSLSLVGPAPTLEQIDVSPTNVSIAEGESQQFTATGTYSNSTTQDITNSVNWASSDTGVATIDASGLATGQLAGTSNITAALDSVTSNTASLDVTVPPPSTLESITVSPSSASIDEGQAQQFTATGTYSDSSMQDITSSVSWTSSDTVVATINTSGLAAGQSAGTSDITASLDGVVSNAAMLTVTGPSAIDLSANGYKVRGLQKADLAWSGATSSTVDVYRNNSPIATTANDGFHTDNINARGGGSYTYKVCEAGTSTCSNNVVVSF